MGSQLEHRDRNFEAMQGPTQNSEHAAAEAVDAFKPQGKGEKAEPKEPDRVSFNHTDLYAGENKQSSESHTEQHKLKQDNKPTDKEQTANSYEIARGDNLTRIAQKILGDNASDRAVVNYINAIARQNHLQNKNLIYAGETLTLPTIQLTDSSHSLTSPEFQLSTKGTSEENPTRPESDTQTRSQSDLRKQQEPANNGAQVPDSNITNTTDNSKRADTDGATESTANASDHKQPLSTDNSKETTADGQITSGDRPPVTTDNLVELKDGREDAEGATSDKIELQNEHENLEKLAHSKMSPEEFLNFSTNMNKLERRIGDMEDALKKQGLPPEEASRKAHEQIGNTYRQIGTLLQAKDNPSVPIDASGRSRLAGEIMSNAADPTEIRQGFHGTCNVTTIESRLYTREPATAARMVVDMATTGEYVSADGTKIKLDQQSLQPDQDAQKKKNSDTNRNFASQLLQVTAVNLHYSKINPDLHYEQHKIDPTLTPPDTGERIVDHSSNPPKELTVSWFNKTFLNRDASEYHSPGLNSEDMVRINEAITGKPERDWLLDASGGHGEGVVKPASAQDLEEKLLDAKKAGKLPLTVVVHTGNEPFLTDSGDGSAGGSGGWHVVNVTDIEPGSPASISVDNQWTKQEDHLVDNKVSSRELFGAMKAPGDAETLTELQAEVSENRKSGKIDDFKELELLRLQKVTGKISEDQYNQAFLEHLEESQSRWHETMSHGTNDLAAMKNMEKAAARQTEILTMLPADQRVKAIEIEEEAGYQSNAQVDRHLGFSIAKTRRDYEADSSNAEPMPEEKRLAYQRATHRMVEIIDAMPAERRENIRQMARACGEEDNKARQAKYKSPTPAAS